MRPVNKGDSPYQTISDYHKALSYLEGTIGEYCSYCEMPIQNAPEVEHVVSKGKGGNITAWGNLLLACKYCNSRKSDTTTPTNKNDYIWPDEDNTAIAFQYTNGIPKINQSDLLGLDPSGNLFRRAENLFNLIKLDNIPLPSQKDRRFGRRIEAFECAKRSLCHWKAAKSTSLECDMKEQIVMTAVQTGFFSIWSTVFYNEPELLIAFIEAFPGTNRECFDRLGHPSIT